VAGLSDAPLRVAVFGDVHGHLTLAYRLVKRWERENAAAIDLILQVGDLGAFPPPYRLDKATKRFAERDPDELGFATYFEGGDEAEEVLGPDAPAERAVDAPLVFVRGNHEDFVFLADVAAGGEPPQPTDPYQKILYLPNGARFTFRRGALALAVGALGGISLDGGPGRDPASEFYTAGEARRLRAGGPLDVLLTHEPPFGAAATLHPRYAGEGSRDAASLVRECAPRFHFCGHYHEPGGRLEAPAGTESYLLNAVNFLRPQRLNPGCFGVLTWGGPDEAHFSLVGAPWTAEYTRSNFRHR
jgi:hypothetical protein